MVTRVITLMKKIISAFMLVSGVLLFESQMAIKAQPAPQLLSGDSVKKDLLLLRELLYAMHPGQFMNCSEKDFKACYDSIYGSIPPHISFPAFYKCVNELLSAVKDGHTRSDKAIMYSFLENRKVFPFGIYMMNGKFLISRTMKKDRSYFLGNELLAINGKKMSVVVSEIKQGLSLEAENRTGINYELRSFPFYYSLLDTAQAFHLEYKTHEGQIKDTIVLGVKINAFRAETKTIVPPIAFKITENAVAILTLNTFNIDDFKYRQIDYKKYIDSCFAVIKKQDLKKLIIDVRGNSGGSAEISNYLFSFLISVPYYYFESVCRKNFEADKWKQFDLNPQSLQGADTNYTVFDNGLYCERNTGRKNYWWFEKQKPKRKVFQGRLITLVDGGSFSTAGHFATLVREHHVGTLYGECTQGSYYSNDGSRLFKLPYTGILVYIPTAQFKMYIRDLIYDPRGICPDVEVQKTNDDFLFKKDSQLQAALDGLWN